MSSRSDCSYHTKPESGTWLMINRQMSFRPQRLAGEPHFTSSSPAFTMNACRNSKIRWRRLPSQDPKGQGHPGSPQGQRPPLLLTTSSMECPPSCPLTSQRERHCPVCLQVASFPVQTNCGHLFCAPCLIAYWRHGTWLDAVNCPLCRQKVSVMCQLFNESRPDQQSKDVLGQISDYNKRYSGAPRRIRDYLSDAPILLQLAVRGSGTPGGLVWLFFLRVALCCAGTAVSVAYPPTPSGSLKTSPTLCGLLGLLDDLVVVVLLLLCVLNVNHQMAPGRGRSAGARAVAS
ncbi:E3 ubiquitin-protein ligase RNF170 isoform X2 [Hippocampus comes]|uniref:E3 ubiquitin-protein ligase RNF170 isoform X2 n=1 Tax=Hippocampus comes TaxID=109280 RepID=UPI00094E7C94|nr:PREDICTED: E3 ubiquitin-protein ligase RNF170-like isoform X2 [Hippocampus comes]